MASLTLQWGRVDDDAEGASTVENRLRPQIQLQWGRVDDDAEGSRTLRRKTAARFALQWGRVDDDAEGSLAGLLGYKRVWLQWGRVDDDAEGVMCGAEFNRSYGSFNGAASMTTRKAQGLRIGGVYGYVLQWGRVDDDAEGLPATPASLTFYPLQWGRVDDDAEGQHAVGPRALERLLASMGPRR